MLRFRMREMAHGLRKCRGTQWTAFSSQPMLRFRLAVQDARRRVEEIRAMANFESFGPPRNHKIPFAGWMVSHQQQCSSRWTSPYQCRGRTEKPICRCSVYRHVGHFGDACKLFERRKRLKLLAALYNYLGMMIPYIFIQIKVYDRHYIKISCAIVS